MYSRVIDRVRLSFFAYLTFRPGLSLVRSFVSSSSRAIERRPTPNNFPDNPAAMREPPANFERSRAPLPVCPPVGGRDQPSPRSSAAHPWREITPFLPFYSQNSFFENQPRSSSFKIRDHPSVTLNIIPRSAWKVHEEKIPRGKSRRFSNIARSIPCARGVGPLIPRSRLIITPTPVPTVPGRSPVTSRATRAPQPSKLRRYSGVLLIKYKIL